MKETTIFVDVQDDGSRKFILTDSDRNIGVTEDIVNSLAGSSKKIGTYILGDSRKEPVQIQLVYRRKIRQDQLPREAPISIICGHIAVGKGSERSCCLRNG
jgi:hypothetical protein